LFHHDEFACTCCHSRQQTSPPQPLDDDGMLLWFEGEIYNPDAFGLPADSTAPEALLCLIRRQPDFSFLAKLDGVFAAVVYDPGERRLHLFTDRAGMSRLCWTIVDNQLLWAAEK
jgi:asparagine synthetase B (glutamine-hydrolysing)